MDVKRKINRKAGKRGYAVITGASSGIGAEFARQLSAKGFPLILIARREDRLKQLAADLGTLDTSLIYTADLSSETECRQMMSWLADKKISVFINNAGFGDAGLFTDSSLDKGLDMIDVNVRALYLLTRQVLDIFERQKSGYLLNVASSAGLLPAGPYMAGYYASKAYVTSLTRAISRELREKKSPVYIGCLCPGPVNTEFNDRANVEFALPGISPEECVREAIKGMMSRRTVIVPTFTMKAAVFFGRFLPQGILIAVTGRQQKKKLAGKPQNRS